MEYFEETEMRRVLQVAMEHDAMHHLSLLTCLFHGLRISELVGQHLDNPSHKYHHPGLRGVDVVNGEINIHALKGSENGLQPVHVDNDPLTDESPLIKLAAENPGRIFQFTRQNADLFIKKYVRLAGLHPSKGHMHALKHTIAMMIWERTHNLGIVKSYLRHKAASSTMMYLVEADRRKAFAAVAGIRL